MTTPRESVPTMKFDKPDNKSPYLSFLAAEFHRRGTDLRRELSSKATVHSLLKDMTVGGTHIGLPHQYEVLTSTDQISPEVLGERVALKFANGWSAKGVMLLERTGQGRYFDHFSLREWTLKAIREKQQAVADSFRRKKPAWIVEELLYGSQPGAIPFDYKFYVFQGQIALVSQIDRNATPARNAFLGPDLKPLVEERDYRLTSENLQPAVPIVPRSAVMLSRWAIELSKMTDAPFVRVDLYDTDKGPYFGEFTFSSGAEYKRTIMFSRKLLNEFDRMFVNAEKTLNGEPTEVPRNWSTLLQSTNSDILASQPRLSLAEYERLAYNLYNQDSLAGLRLGQAQDRLLKDGADADVNQHLSRAHKLTAQWVEARHKLAPPVLDEAVRQVREDARSAKAVADEIGFPLRRLKKLVKDAEVASQEPEPAGDPEAVRHMSGGEP